MRFSHGTGLKMENGPNGLLNGTKRPTKRYTFTTHRFYKKDDPLSESGLIGPVALNGNESLIKGSTEF